jgi:hypothetical protein
MARPSSIESEDHCGCADESTGVAGTERERDTRLRLACRREILRQADGQHMPGLAMAVGRCVKLGAEDGREAIAAESPRVGDREFVAGHEMVGEAEEVVARVAVEPADFPGRKSAVGEVRMGVEIAAPELSRRSKGLDAHDDGAPASSPTDYIDG